LVLKNGVLSLVAYDVFGLSWLLGK
jgi:hypothetical protein